MPNAGHLVHGKGDTIYSVEPGASVLDAIRHMAERHVGALLVMQGGRLVGIVSERDYARKVILQDRSSKSTPVSDIMSSPVITVSPSATLDECMRMVTDNRVRHLPVLDESRVVGVLSIGDLVKAQLDEQAREIEQLQTYIAS